MEGLLRRVTFRVEHDCALARFSREVPEAALQVWSGHRFEVVHVRVAAEHWPTVVAAARRHLDPVRVLGTSDGGLVVWHPQVVAGGSISRRLEAHDLMWLQPLRVEAGWEHYDAIAFGDGEQAALDDLRVDHATQVVGRGAMGAQDVAASLFLSLHPVLEAPTDKQAEALMVAGEAGYYATPRRTTTAKAAALLGIGRSAFEERLRGAENRVMEALLPALRWARGRRSGEGDRRHR